MSTAIVADADLSTTTLPVARSGAAVTFENEAPFAEVAAAATSSDYYSDSYACVKCGLCLRLCSRGHDAVFSFPFSVCEFR